ncbi:M23 family metallopeptidase [Nitrosococcus oceani]|uniref:Peptidase M23B n=3 Tax=Nitrosococcus oceani TaxID=1229 RepID=Q3J798_NITOC|nr:M23 family metallopeptidase [Nitrosococcus oceani]ABA59298.1 Peptidase M23B [Nitrosococcus oceani ATCC 19707]KFI18326.1 membrane protein [Nitrosococcus oceani C-27]KFI21504.1 membrane protein [Nitrosococcus oceani]GEM21124.1 peptidase M23 [Nitrosococcus oceani]
MDIIILPKASRSRNCIHLGTRAFFACLFLILTFLLLTVYGAYHFGMRTQFTVQQESLAQMQVLTKDWQARLERQQAMLAATTKQAEEGLGVLAQRLGYLQANVIRLNALGQRLIVYADLEQGEFDFTHPPAMGGPESRIGEIPKLSDFLATMEQLAQEITDRQQQLRLLETMLLEWDIQQAALPAGRPLHQGWLSSKYGYRTDPFNGRREFHNGVDFAGKAGTKILAVAAGIVTWVGKRSGYGRMVEINHGNGYVTRYAHNRKNLVQVGEHIVKGQVIALMGSSGRSTGPHVHLEVLHEGRTVDPLQFVRAVEDS